MDGSGTQPRSSSPGRSTDKFVDLVFALLLALVGFTLYATTAVPGPFDGDHGEFQYIPRLLGLPHPTGYPIYVLLGWLWSWLPLGTLAFRMNLFSAFWAAFTLAVVFALARQQGLKRVAALSGALVLALAPAFWRYAGLAAVYTLHTALLAVALGCWLCWAEAPGYSSTKWLWAATFFTGLALTNHPTAALFVPAAALFLLLGRFPWPLRKPNASLKNGHWAFRRRPRLREAVVAVVLFVLPGLLYLYVPIRLWTIGPGVQRYGLQESFAKGRIAPFLDWTLEGVSHYITGREFTESYEVKAGLLWTMLPGLLKEELGIPLVMLGATGAVLWCVRRLRSGVLLATLFVLSAAYATSYSSGFAARSEIVHLKGHLMPAFLVFALWIAQGVSSGIDALSRLLGRARLASGLVTLLLVLAFTIHVSGQEMPTSADRLQSQSIHRYWTEVLAYPLEEASAVIGHWGDLTPFWYFQHGEGIRPDLWAIFPPDVPQIDTWLTRSGRPAYLAGPLLDWNPDLAEKYNLTPWGVLVRVDPRDRQPSLPLMEMQSALFGDRLQLEGYNTLSPDTGRWQLWLAWRTVAPTRRDLSVSVRLHAPDGTQLLQKDGRLASLWYPEGTMPADQQLLTVFDLEPVDELPRGTVVRIVVYDPETMMPLLTGKGLDVFELGPLRRD